MADLRISGPGGAFEATVTVPGDKSLSHRALLFAGMATGDSLVDGLGPGADVASTAAALERLGVSIEGAHVRSPGIADWSTADTPIDCGNSGTTMRLLSGILSTSTASATLVGDDSLMARPMARLIAPLTALGGVVEVGPDGRPPIVAGGADRVRHAAVRIPMASAQVRTAFELAALAGDAESEIDSPPGFRDHTERWLEAIGLGRWTSSTAFRITPGTIPPARYEVPGDPSSAAYLWAVAALHPGSTMTTPRVSLNPGRLGFLQVLEAMGATIEAEVTGTMGGDPVGDVRVTGAGLVATTVDGALAAAALDELPLVSVLGAFADGITTIRDAEELRGKESDRIAAVVKMVQALGGGAEELQGGLDVLGTGFLEAGVVDTAHDHRIAMAGAVAATRIDGGATILDADVASVSWPGFYATLEGLWS